MICCKESKNTTSAPPVGSRSRERCSGTYSLTQMDEEVTSKGNALIQRLYARKVQASGKDGQAKQFSQEDELALQTELAAFQRLISRGLSMIRAAAVLGGVKKRGSSCSQPPSRAGYKYGARKSGILCRPVRSTKCWDLFSGQRRVLCVARFSGF